MPAHKKHASTRARGNSATTAAKLTLATSQDYTSWTVAQLRTEVDARNAGRQTSAALAKPKTKAGLVAALVADDSPVPELPYPPPGVGPDGELINRVWHPEAVRWWNDVWSSPMSPEWDESDIHNVTICALLFDDIWSAPTAKERKDAASEFRLQRKDLGLTPYDRRRLEWTIETAAEATDRGNARRQDSAHSEPRGAQQPAEAEDPRLALVQ